MANCGQCGGGGAGRDGRCGKCRLEGFGQARRKYFFNEALTADLRAAYRGNKCDLSRALDQLEARTKWPRWAFRCEAIRLGIVQGGHRRLWTAEEDAHLAEWLGRISVTAIARQLGRTVLSVESRAARQELSLRAREGYNLTDLAAVLGVRYLRVRGWVERGLLGRVREWQGLRVKEAAVARFIRRYPHEYDLRRVDEVWFKAMVFGFRADARTGERE